MRKKKADSSSIIKNGSFKKLNKYGKPANWSTSRKAEDLKGIQVDQQVFRDGGQALKLTAPPSGNNLVCQYLPKLKPNKTYLLTYFVKIQNISPFLNKKGGVCVNVWSSHNEWFPKNYYTEDMPWTKQGFIIKTDNMANKKHRSYIRLRIMNASGTVWFDDVRLREVN